MEKSMRSAGPVRSKNASRIQRRSLLELMKQYRYVGMGKCPDKTTRKAVWDLVAAELNNMNGPTKTAAQWNKHWTDWRKSVRKQYAMKNKISNSTEHPDSETLEKEVMEFIVDNEEQMQQDGVFEDTCDCVRRTSVGDIETFVDLTEAEDNEEKPNFLDETPNEFVETGLADAPKMSENYPESSTASSQSFSEINRACSVNQIQILDVLSKNTGFIAKQSVENRDPPSSQMFSELERVLSNNQTLLESLKKITGLIENQNAILFQMMQAMSRKN